MEQTPKNSFDWSVLNQNTIHHDTDVRKDWTKTDRCPTQNPFFFFFDGVVIDLGIGALTYKMIKRLNTQIGSDDESCCILIIFRSAIQ